MTAAGPAGRWRARDLELELVDPASLALTRLFQHDRMDWDPPAEEYRNLRVDPPLGHKGAFAVLYTASTLPAAAIECRILNVDASDLKPPSRVTSPTRRSLSKYSSASQALHTA